MVERSKRLTDPRKPVTTKIAANILECLKAAAVENNRTLGAEIEFRLLASFGSDLGTLIQKAVADGIAAHEAAKREELMKRVTVHSSGVYGVNQSISSGNSYLSLYGIQSAQHS